MKTKTLNLEKMLFLLLMLLTIQFNTVAQIWDFDNPMPTYTVNFEELTSENCDSDDTYWIGPNKNSQCSSFDDLTGNGDFLTANSGDAHFKFTTTTSLSPNSYVFRARVARRETWEPDEENFQLLIGTTLVANFMLPSSITWTNIEIPMIVPPGVTGNFSIFVNNTNGAYADFSIDDISITQCNPLPTSIFNLTNQAGILKTNFCLGEEIILNGTPSTNELGYMISIQDVTGPTYPAPTDLIAPNGTTWFQGAIGLVNLSQAFANSNPSYKLLPGRTYKVRLAVYNSCISWVPSEQIITVNCCPNFINPSFQLNSLAITSGVYKLTADNYNRYPNINSTHLWYVYKYTNSNGPFTYVTTINNPEFNFFGNNMQCYLVIHKIITPCGEVCYGQKICNNAGIVGGGLSGGPFVGLIPGCVLPPVCQAPNQLGCVPLPGSIYPNARQLRWNNVPGAVSYQLVRVYNDPLCCNGTPIITLPPVTISPNSLLPYTSFDVEPDYLGSCFSWKIIVTCSNGLTATSAPKCFGPTYPCDWGSPIGSMNRMAITGNIEEPEISAFPNPVTDGILKLSIQGVDQNLVTDMIVYSMDGRRVINSKYKGNCVESVNVSNLPAGLYFLKAFQNNNQVYVTKFEKR